MAESNEKTNASGVEEKEDGFAWLRYLIGFPSKKKEQGGKPELQHRQRPEKKSPMKPIPPTKQQTRSEKTELSQPILPESPDISAEPFSEEFPTWLRQDLNLSESIPPIDAPILQEDNLSWLDGIASGLGAALDEPPTMNWEESDIMLTHNAAISSKTQEATEFRAPKKGRAADDSVIEPSPVIEDDQSAPTIFAFDPSPSADADSDSSQPMQSGMIEQVAEAEELFASEIERLQDEPSEFPTAFSEPRRPFSSLTPELLDDEGTLISSPKANIDLQKIPADPDEAMLWLENLASKKDADATAIPQFLGVDEGTHPTGEIPQLFDDIDDSFWRLPGVDDIDEDEGTFISAETVLPQPVEDERNFLLQGLDTDIDDFSSFDSELSHQEQTLNNDEIEAGLGPDLFVESADVAKPLLETDQNEESAEAEQLLPQPEPEETPSKLADFDEALAWLEGLSGEADYSLDEITLELNQEDVVALLDGERNRKIEEIANSVKQTPLSESEPQQLPDLDLVDPIVTISPSSPSEPSIVTTSEEQEITSQLTGSAETELPKQPVIPTPPALRARHQVPKKSTEHHDALAWLETFSAERTEQQREHRPNIIVGRHIMVDEPTIIQLFARERLFARDAVDIGNYKEATDVYQELLQLDNQEATDAIIAELSKVVETVTDYAPFYVILGDAYQKASYFEESSKAYRQAISLFLPPKN